MSELNKEEYLNAHRKIKGSDKIGLFGKIGVVATGAGAAGGAASILGTSSIPLLTTAASSLGVTLVATTPIGWIIAASVVGGLASSYMAKAVHNGGINDEKKKRLEHEIIKKIEENPIVSEDKIQEVVRIYDILLERNILTQDEVLAILSSVKNGSTDADYAINLAYSEINNSLNDPIIKS